MVELEQAHLLLRDNLHGNLESFPVVNRLCQGSDLLSICPEAFQDGLASFQLFRVPLPDQGIGLAADLPTGSQLGEDLIRLVFVLEPQGNDRRVGSEEAVPELT